MNYTTKLLLFFMGAMVPKSPLQLDKTYPYAKQPKGEVMPNPRKNFGRSLAYRSKYLPGVNTPNRNTVAKDF